MLVKSEGKEHLDEDGIDEEDIYHLTTIDEEGVYHITTLRHKLAH